MALLRLRDGAKASCGVDRSSLQHAIAKEAGIEQRRWQYAIYEGGADGFSSEQMHHWVTAGHLDASKLLIRRLPEHEEDDAEDTRNFQPLSRVFPDSERAFVPSGMDVNAWTLLAHRLAAVDGQLASHRHRAAASTTASASARRDMSTGAQSAARTSGSDIGGLASSPNGDVSAAATTGVTASAAPPPQGEAFSRAEIDASAAGVSAYFRSGDAWYYLDAAAEQHGPFSGSKMSEWFRGGFLWQRKLQVGHDGWPSFSLLQEIVDEATEAAAEARAEIHPPTQAASRPPEAKAARPTDATEMLAEPDSESETEDATGAASSASAEASLTAAAAALSPLFVYADDDGTLQGPFEKGVMAAWAAEGMLPAELRVRPARDGDEQGQKPANANSWFRADELFDVLQEEEDEAAAAVGEEARGARVLGPSTPPLDAATAAPVGQVGAGASIAPTADLATGAVTKFADDAMLEYLDDAGERQGPFDALTVQQWITQGFFTPDTKTRPVDATAWTEMRNHFEFDDRG